MRPREISNEEAVDLLTDYLLMGGKCVWVSNGGLWFFEPYMSGTRLGTVVGWRQVLRWDYIYETVSVITGRSCPSSNAEDMAAIRDHLLNLVARIEQIKEWPPGRCAAPDNLTGADELAKRPH